VLKDANVLCVRVRFNTASGFRIPEAYLSGLDIDGIYGDHKPNECIGNLRLSV
jgi:hypothetical protein